MTEPRHSSATGPIETASSGVRVPGNGFHPLNGQQVRATYTKHYSGRLVDEGPSGAALRLVDADGLTVCYVDGERWTIEAAPMVEPIDIYAEIRAERERAHAKHGETSMESAPVDDPTGRRFRILSEEVGEIAKEFNDAEHDRRPVDLAKVRNELIQTAAMATAWADRIPLNPRPLQGRRPVVSSDITKAVYDKVVGEWVAGSHVEQALAADFDPRPIVALVLRMAARSEVSARIPAFPHGMRYRFTKDARQALFELAAEFEPGAS
jgi:hypothetical protein